MVKGKQCWLLVGNRIQTAVSHVKVTYTQLPTAACSLTCGATSRHFCLCFWQRRVTIRTATRDSCSVNINTVLFPMRTILKILWQMQDSLYCKVEKKKKKLLSQRGVERGQWYNVVICVLIVQQNRIQFWTSDPIPRPKFTAVFLFLLSY